MRQRRRWCDDHPTIVRGKGIGCRSVGDRPSGDCPDAAQSDSQDRFPALGHACRAASRRREGLVQGCRPRCRGIGRQGLERHLAAGCKWRRGHRLGAARCHGGGPRPRHAGHVDRRAGTEQRPRGAGAQGRRHDEGQGPGRKEGRLHRRHELGAAGRSLSGGRWDQPGQGQPGQCRPDGAAVDLRVGRGRCDLDDVSVRKADRRSAASVGRHSHGGCGPQYPELWSRGRAAIAAGEGRPAAAFRAGAGQGLGIHLPRQDRRGGRGDREAAAERQARYRHHARPDRRISALLRHRRHQGQALRLAIG